MNGYSTPSPEQVEKALRRIPTYQHRRVFYDALMNPNWVRPLFDAGAFVGPDEPKVDEKGLIRETPWPEMDYLVRVAIDAPADVVDVVLGLEASSNSWVRRGVFAIGAIVPASEAARLEPLAKAWRDELGFRTDPGALASMTKNLLAGGEAKFGRSMANILFRPRTPAQEGGKPLTGVEEYWYEQELPAVAEALGDDALTVTIPWLEEWEKLDGRFGSGNDFTGFNRSSISSREDGFASVEQSLIDAVRDAAMRAFGKLPDETSRRFIARPMIILRKIALYALGQVVLALPSSDATDPFATAGEMLLLDPLSADYKCRLEFADLYLALQQRGADLDSVLTSVIEAGPFGSADQVRDLLSHRASGPELEEEVLEYTENWQQRLLATIGAQYLPASLADLLADLDARHGAISAPREPDFKVTSWTGPTSPVGQDQLAEMTASELIDFLETWRSGDEWMGPTHEGVARELTEVITKNPKALEGQRDLIQRLRPTYLRGIISGWDAAYRAGGEIDWASAIELLGAVIAHSNETHFEVEGRQFDDDPDFSGTKQSSVSLLTDIARGDSKRSVPSDVLTHVANLLLESLADEGPWARYNEREVKDDMDPFTISINWRWPIAVRGLVNLVSRGPDTEWFEKTRLALEVELSREDRIGATRAVLGEGLGRLLNGAPEWITARSREYFGGESELSRNQQIALTTTLATHNVHALLVEFLRPSFMAAIRLAEPVTVGWRNHQKGLDLIGHWIVVCLIWDVIQTDDPLVTAFYELADADTRGAVIGHIAWSFMNSTVIDPEVKARLEELWDSRTKHVRRHPEDAAELKDFYWFVRSEKFDVEWWMPRLREAAELHANLNTRGMIGEQLGAAAAQMPREALEATRRLMNRDEETGMLGYDLNEHAVPLVIAAALDSGDRELAADASKFMNDLGAQGYVTLEERVNQHRRT